MLTRAGASLLVITNTHPLSHAKKQPGVASASSVLLPLCITATRAAAQPLSKACRLSALEANAEGLSGRVVIEEPKAVHRGLQEKRGVIGERAPLLRRILDQLAVDLVTDRDRDALGLVRKARFMTSSASSRSTADIPRIHEVLNPFSGIQIRIDAPGESSLDIHAESL